MEPRQVPFPQHERAFSRHDPPSPHTKHRWIEAELKCEIEFERYQYLTLNDFGQLEHHTRNAAFQKLLRAAADPGAQRVTIRGREIQLQGAVLVWGVVTDQGQSSVKDEYGFVDVLSIEQMLKDLGEWQPQEWARWVGLRRQWTDELFGWLTYPAHH